MLVLRVITFIAAGIAAAILFLGMAGANGAPQEAAAGAVAAALVIIPYAVTSTVQRARLIKLAERSDRDRS